MKRGVSSKASKPTADVPVQLQGIQAEDTNWGVVSRWFTKPLVLPEHSSGPLCGRVLVVLTSLANWSLPSAILTRSPRLRVHSPALLGIVY